VHEWLPVSSDLEREAVGRWLARFSDQDFSVTDAVSFEIMRRNRLTDAFAFDQHFVTAGFKLLGSGSPFTSLHRTNVTATSGNPACRNDSFTRASCCRYTPESAASARSTSCDSSRKTAYCASVGRA
jgi:hypothetical protein